MLPPALYKRLDNLNENIARANQLLQELEEAKELARHPLEKRQYLRDIENLKETVQSYTQEFQELDTLLNTSSSEMQTVAVELQQLNQKIDLVLRREATIYQTLLQTRAALLGHYDATQQVVLQAVLTKLDQNGLALTQTLLNALDTNQLSQNQMQQLLSAMTEHIKALPSAATEVPTEVTEVVKNPSLDIKHRLKYCIPLIPLLLEYEGEMELGSGMDLGALANNIINRLQRRKTS